MIVDFYGRDLDDLLNELKVYGAVKIYNKEYKWCCEYHVTIKQKEYMFETCNEDLSTLVKNCLIAIYMLQSRK